jgi:predicted ATPase
MAVGPTPLHRTRRGKPTPTNLPVLRDPLIGRSQELEVARTLLLRDDVGLVTLTGVGGSGKTRLALEVARRAQDEFDDGVFFVSLAPLSDPFLVASTIARTLDLQDFGGRSPEMVLRAFLREKRLLLVLDNFEHLVEAAPLVDELLAHAAGLSVLATSRSSLRVQVEHELVVPPLAIPELPAEAALQALGAYGSVALFVRRSASIRHGFTLTQDNAAAVVEICRRLDGLPLAIELAAARTKLFSPHELLRRLDRRLPLLGSGARNMPARQRTLRDAIAWSYDLIGEDEQRLFRRLAIFAGGCTLESATAISRFDGDGPTDVLDGVASLIDQHLVQSYEATTGTRFRMLETIREFAIERLEAAGELAKTATLARRPVPSSRRRGRAEPPRARPGGVACSPGV